MQPHTAPPGDAWQLGRGPFIFGGVPPICAGDLELINSSDEKVRVRTIPVVGYENSAASNLGLAELRVGVRLAPRDRTRARAYFAVKPHTPPGTYTADLSCGSQRERVVVHVRENQSLRIDPEEIHLRGAAGDVLTTVVVVTNDGNVSETMRDLALVFLEERNWVGRSLVQALRDTKADEGHQTFLDRLTRELRVTMARPARVTIRSDNSELRPGETREIELETELPAELIKGRFYFGQTPFMSGELFFEVECNGAKNSTKRR
jgi:hypothetical protein